MAVSILFKVGTTDYTGNVVQNTWDVNKLPVYKEYKDANEEKHKRFLRNKISGSFKMVFKDLTDFAAFQTTLDNARSATNFTVFCTVYDNKHSTTETINAFIDFKPGLRQSVGLEEYIEPFTVTLEEQ